MNIHLFNLIFIVLLLIPPAGFTAENSLSGTMSGKAYKATRGENDTGQNATNNIPSLFIPPACNPVEFGGIPPYPIAIASLEKKVGTIPKSRFFIIAGKAEWLPPDPGPAGKQTLAGIDADGDCVRDDIELYIASLCPNNDHVIARKYLFEYAKLLGFFLTTPNLDSPQAEGIKINIYKAIQCVRNDLGDNDQTSKTLDNVFAHFLNTFSRSDKYIEKNSLLGGWTSRESLTSKCN